jgi:hypothetical protein
MYFGLRSVDLPIECAHPTSKSAHDCDNAEVVATDLVITKLVLEVDSSKYGEYGRCNVCVNGSDHHGNNSCTDGAYDCLCGSYTDPPMMPTQLNASKVVQETKPECIVTHPTRAGSAAFIEPCLGQMVVARAQTPQLGLTLVFSR